VKNRRPICPGSGLTTWKGEQTGGATAGRRVLATRTKRVWDGKLKKNQKQGKEVTVWFQRVSTGRTKLGSVRRKVSCFFLGVVRKRGSARPLNGKIWTLQEKEMTQEEWRDDGGSPGHKIFSSSRTKSGKKPEKKNVGLLYYHRYGGKRSSFGLVVMTKSERGFVKMVKQQ